MSNVEHQTIHLLKEHNLRVTDSRAQILKVFLQKSFALSQPDLERALGETLDRVTIYRTLTSFVENGLLHKVLDDAGASKFALCTHHHETEAHADEHIHFKCLNCNNTHCLDHLTFPQFHAPSGYSFSNTNVLIQGVCPDCNSENRR
ncbi:MAG: Fur family transcriptional regulator [Bacteroidia bacterium]